MVVTQYYPFDIKKFPNDDDLLLDEKDLQRKNVIYCRMEILEQMKCTQWARVSALSCRLSCCHIVVGLLVFVRVLLLRIVIRHTVCHVYNQTRAKNNKRHDTLTKPPQDEFLAAGKDPQTAGGNEWFHYHLSKCYTPYMDAVGCLHNITDKEVQKMKRELGSDGWKKMKETFIHDAAKKVGENKAKMMWELSTNMKEIHERTRKRDGPLFGESPLSVQKQNQSTTTAAAAAAAAATLPPPRCLSEAIGLSSPVSTTGNKQEQDQVEVENMFAAAKRVQLNENKVKQQQEQNKSIFGKFGF